MAAIAGRLRRRRVGVKKRHWSWTNLGQRGTEGHSARLAGDLFDHRSGRGADGVLTLRERRRQIAIARTRPALDEAAFCNQMEDASVPNALARFIWREIQPYYFRPLTPWPSDRIYGDLRIDPDDINDITIKYEKEFSVQLKENSIDCPPDPTLAQWMVALDRASR